MHRRRVKCLSCREEFQRRELWVFFLAPEKFCSRPHRTIRHLSMPCRATSKRSTSGDIYQFNICQFQFQYWKYPLHPQFQFSCLVPFPSYPSHPRKPPSWYSLFNCTVHPTQQSFEESRQAAAPSAYVVMCISASCNVQRVQPISNPRTSLMVWSCLKVFSHLDPISPLNLPFRHGKLPLYSPSASASKDQVSGSPLAEIKLFRPKTAWCIFPRSGRFCFYICIVNGRTSRRDPRDTWSAHRNDTFLDSSARPLPIRRAG